MNSEPADPSFETLIDYIGRARGFDFSGYKRPTLTRRVRKRLYDLQLSSFGEYMDYLEVHADEFELLFNTILINVTSFYRDRPAWDYLAETVVPRILDEANPDEAIRIWSAGCASGEEAYTLAIVLAEAMGEARFRSQVKIYATDVDSEALAQARAGSYPLKVLHDVPAELRDRYFDGSGPDRSFRADLRRAVIFGRHDLTRDAPISRLKLVTCRNTLMYFNAETQAAIVRRLHFGLTSGGVLFLGRAEMLLSHGDLFKPLSTPFRISTKIQRPDAHRAAPSAHPGKSTAAAERAQRGGAMHELASQTMRIPQLIVDADGIVVAINDAARSAFDLIAADVGRPFSDLEVSYRPVDLRTPIDSASTERHPVELRAVELRGAATAPRYFDILVTPIGLHRQPLLGAAVTFVEVTRIKELQTELKRTSEELETAYEELQSSNEELETTNEELQSTVEELETTNEELQSTNEELETTNEELRSTNEELETINDELGVRTEEANDASAYLSSIVDGVSVGVVVVDDKAVVRTWNLIAEEMWGLRAEEVIGHSLFDLDSGLPVGQLRHRIESGTIRDGTMQEIVIDAINRRGRPVRCLVRFTLLHSTARPGIVMLIEEVAGGSP
jgi:two-component system CheB/CheR fusion protein